MTTKKAVKLFKGTIDAIENKRTNPASTTCIFNWNLKQLTEMSQLAINALEKQIPKKPNNYNDGFLYCESCGHPTLHSDKQEAYCFVCGQAQDWSDNQ